MKLILALGEMDRVYYFPMSTLFSTRMCTHTHTHTQFLTRLFVTELLSLFLCGKEPSPQ